MFEKKKKSLAGLWIALGVMTLLLGAAAFTFLINRWQVQVRLHGPEEITVECCSGYLEPGADGVFGGTILFREHFPLEVQLEGTVDSDKPGDYTLRYRAEHWWCRDEAVRTVHVVDTTPPALKLVSDPEHYTLPGHTYEEEGYTALDLVDGDLTDRVEVREEDGKVYYSVTDAAGNKAEAEREIFYDDPIPPEITLLGDAEMSVTAGLDFTDPGFTAQDNVDGDLTAQVEVTGSVNTWLAGKYELTYSVEDGYHNRTTVVRHVTVNALRQPDQVNPGNKIVYLTFDDGPSANTQTLLDVLAKYNVKATFFVVNYGYASMIAKEAAAGHSIGIHSATHDYKTIYASEDAFFADLNKMMDIVVAQTGKRTTLIRFPGGSSNRVSDFNPGIMTRLVQAVTDQGYQYFDWNVSSGDAGETTDTDVVYQNVIDGISSHNVSIVLQHDSKAYSVAAVERIIIWGLAHGYTFLPLTPSSPTAHHHINN